METTSSLRVYTIGFTRRSAESFFSALREAGIRRLLDVRLRNSSQLAGFSKKDDLQYFLRELCAAEYVHDARLTPTDELLDGIRKKRIDWSEYDRRFRTLMADRHIENVIAPDFFKVPTVLLCTEPAADRCHRRLVLEHLQRHWGDLDIVHL